MIALSFDIEPDLHTNDYKGVYEGIPRIAKILDNLGAKATFFVSCDCIEKYPGIFQNLKKKGHEIALHGYRHTRFDDLTLEQKEEQIKKSILCFKKYLNQHPGGFRAPQHSIDKATLNLLEKHGFKYDSSKTPLNIIQSLVFFKRLKLNALSFFSSTRINKIGKLKEIPISSFIIPAVSIVFRVLPRSIVKLYLRFMKLINKDIVFYAHSWDFIDLPESRVARRWHKEKLIKNLYLFKGSKFSRIIDL